eukprot:TRINITY_DN15355_c0_g1_i2.p1 TRINITY_DN15355_c0_g1~~TRINITY_DN15355_c0_g1_i2.p1  ORF type:complete len:190 (+),score=14.01 TRINITY_DN15355_c0_g1_i2:575-1144(+)
MSLLGAGGDVRRPQFWSRPHLPPPWAVDAMAAEMALLRANDWVTFDSRVRDTVCVTTDASLHGWGVVISAREVAYGVFEREWADAGIGIKEMIAVCRGVELCLKSRRGVRIQVRCDNKGVIGILARGYSLNGVLMEWVLRIQGCLEVHDSTISCVYVPSEANEADALTRMDCQLRLSKFHGAVASGVSF